jgi:hypothetical protein
MLDRSAKGPSPEKFKNLDRYKPGDRVLVNDKGKWRIAELDAEPVPRGSAQLELKIDGGQTLIVSETPKLLAFKEGIDVLDDPNGKLEIAGGLPTEDGDIEYSVIDAKGKVHRVSEKFLVAWKETLKIEQEVGKMEKQIAALSLQTQKKLREKIAEVKTKIRDVFNNLPDIGEMATQTKRDIETAIEKIAQIHKAAESHITDLRRDITEAEKDVVEVARKNDRFAHVRTVKEIEQINKEGSEATEKLNKKAKSIADRLQKQIEKEIDAQVKTKQDDENIKYQTKLDAWTNNPSPKKGDKPEPKVVSLTDSERKKIEDQAKKDFAEQITDFSKNPNPELENALNKLREEKAKDEPMTGLLDSSGKDYADIAATNKEIFYELLGNWQKTYSPIAYEAPKAKINSEGKAIFDFDNETKELEQELEALLSDTSIPKDGGAPKKEYQAVYDRIKDAQRILGIRLNSLQTLDALRATPPYAPTVTQSDLESERLAFIDKLKQDIHKFNIELQTLQIKQGAENKYEQKDRMIPVDLSSALVEKMLLVNLDKSKTAIKAMYHGDATAAFKDIIGDTMPPGINVDQLRKAGIKDWGEFKKIWDKSLAGEVAKNLETIAKQSVLRKASEALDSLSGAFKKAKANIGQVTARNSLNALLLIAPNIALHAVVGQTAGILQNAAMASAGGTASGTIKWLTANKIFGTEKRVHKTKDALGKVQTQTEVIADSLIDKMVDEFFVDTTVPATRSGSGASSGAPATSAKPTGFFGKIGNFLNISKHADKAIDKRVGAQVEKQGRFLEGIPMMSGVIAHTIREITAGEIDTGVLDSGGNKIILKGSDRLRFERAVGQLETKDGMEEQIKNLALLISQMGRKGDDYQQALKEQAGGGVTAMDKYLLAYSGKGNLKDSLAMNIGVNTLLSGIFLASGTARAAFGALLGAHSGWKMGERKYWKSEQKEAKKVLAGRMDTFFNDIKDYATLSVDKKTKFKSELIYLKKFLHGNAAQEDLTAAMFVTAEGPQVDEMLLRQIENLVYEGEKTGVLFEKEEDVTNLTKVIEAMKMYGTEAAQKEEKTGKWFKKFGYKLKYALGGAAVGAGTFLLGGMLVRPAIKWLKRSFGFGHGGAVAQHREKDGGSSVMSDEDYLKLHNGQDQLGHRLSSIDSTQNFAADHNLSVEGGEYLKHLTRDYGLSDPNSLQHILEASKVPHGKAFLTFSGNHSRVIFEEIKLHGDPGKAAQFLRDQSFGASAEAHLGKYFNKNSPRAYEDFVDKYDPNNKQMADALRHALQADDNIAFANKFHQPGFKIDAKGNVLYFGRNPDGTPILSGDGKLVVRGMTKVDIQTSIAETPNPKFDHKLGYMPPDDDSLFEHRVKLPILDKQGNYISVDHPSDGPLGDGPYFVEKSIPLGGGNETHTQKLVTGDTLVTYEPSKNVMQYVDGQTETDGGGDQLKLDGQSKILDPGGRSEKFRLGDQSEKTLESGKNLGPLTEAESVELQHFNNRYAFMINNLNNNRRGADMFGSAQKIIDQKMLEYNKAFSDYNNKILNHVPVDLDSPENREVGELVKVVDGYDPENPHWSEVIPDKDLQLLATKLDPDNKLTMVATGGELLKIWVDGQGGGAEIILGKPGSTFSMDGQSIIEQNNTGTHHLDYVEALEMVSEDNKISSAVAR